MPRHSTTINKDSLGLDWDGLRRGIYSDKYFANVVQVLNGLKQGGYHYRGTNPRNIPNPSAFNVSDALIEAQIFNRRSPIALIAGVDVALTMLRHATGYHTGDQFTETWEHLEVDAVRDGDITYYDGNPEKVLTVIEIRGRYRDFAVLETPILGFLSRASRIATNVYEVLQVSNGKPVLYFPARFDLPQTQALDGYAYWLAVDRYNTEYQQQSPPIVSTDAQGKWWGGKGSGTIPHALIACFLADDVEMIEQFARYVPLDTPRILLADFNNDTLRSAREALARMWDYYREAYQAGDETEMKRWTLDGVRLDTSKNLRDASLADNEPYGISPLLVRQMRMALNSAWESWDVPASLQDIAREYCQKVQIVVSGGFNRERVEYFERSRAPVDSYGVGSTFLSNAGETNTDFTMDIVRVFHAGEWHPIAKVGRKPSDNPDLRRIDLSQY
jgi:nicotinate phosphoribosyltransferase